MTQPPPSIAQHLSLQRHGLRLIVLWLAWFLAMLFHVDLGLMPLFHGRSADIHSQVSPQHLPLVFLAMFVYFLLPLLVLLISTYACTSPHPWRWRRWWAGQVVFSWVYSVTNLAHVLADILVPEARLDQVLLMVVMTLVGLLINREAWLCWRSLATDQSR